MYPGVPAKKIELSDRQKNILISITNKELSSRQQIRRSKIILLASENKSNIEIAKELKIHRHSVIKWRNRWFNFSDKLEDIDKELKESTYRKAILKQLSDFPRSGAPPTFTAKEVCQIISLACEEPSASDRPVTNWTPKEIRSETLKRGIVKSISVPTIKRFLKRS